MCLAWLLLLITNIGLCVKQVLINHAETKDGSGGLLDYVDLESGEMRFQKDPVKSERTITDPTEQQSVIAVRHLTRVYKDSHPGHGQGLKSSIKQLDMT